MRGTVQTKISDQWRVLIAIPTSRAWAPMFGLSLCGLVDRFCALGTRYSLDVMIGSSLLPAARTKCLERAVAEGFTHVLMLDDDMIFAPEAITGMAEAMVRCGMPFIAANYVSKGPGGRPVAQGLDGKTVYSAGKAGIERIADIGLGCALLDVSILSTLEKPWFEVGWVPETQGFLGEDYYFCRLLAHHGHPVYVDHTASRHVGHMGDFMWKENNAPVMPTGQAEPQGS